MNVQSYTFVRIISLYERSYKTRVWRGLHQAQKTT
jgi:hypothetical protein